MSKTLIAMLVHPSQQGEVRYDDRSTFNTAAYCGHSCDFGVGSADILVWGDPQAATAIYDQRDQLTTCLRGNESRVNVLTPQRSQNREYGLPELCNWIGLHLAEYDKVHFVGHHEDYMVLNGMFKERWFKQSLNHTEGASPPSFRTWWWGICFDISNWMRTRLAPSKHG